MDFPTWSAGVTATTRLSYHHVADLNVPISCAGVAVYPGDVIHGDADSITVVPAHLAAELADLCEAQDDLEGYLARRMWARRGALGALPAERGDSGAVSRVGGGRTASAWLMRCR